jgi:Heavy metal associated domain 2
VISRVARRASGARDVLRIVHDTPGRLRFRLPARARIAGISEAIRELMGVSSCAWSPATRSLLVQYRPDAIEPSAIADAVIRHARVPDDVAVDVPSIRRGGAESDQPVIAGAVTALFGEVNRQVSRLTRGVLGLEELVPLALATWAVREVALGRTRALVWSSALWYAHGLFRNYNISSSGE